MIIFLQKYNKKPKLVAFRVVFYLFWSFENCFGEVSGVQCDKFHIHYRLFSVFLYFIEENVVPL